MFGPRANAQGQESHCGSGVLLTPELTMYAIALPMISAQEKHRPKRQIENITSHAMFRTQNGFHHSAA
ncbi:hypothetical protein CY34DRAFT_805719 [Suillus luteus UH-Slu-Lm8-n1]|uniref:Unplaced genomic scaffold CY34scaffold_128, whole genome shotgun sequence n=1 Tax=Suillus luteus UH-Slu-Lm8-n1 TaxID=930992 RepID=A0A0D0AIP9_9AGAM|nr:hypothetical protein CY34DRAFT_805719 [Suillus luteus UH-Slu-Lm8-n1]